MSKGRRSTFNFFILSVFVSLTALYVTQKAQEAVEEIRRLSEVEIYLKKVEP